MPIKRIVLFCAATAVVGTAIIAFAWRRSDPAPIARVEAEREVLATLLADPSYSEIEALPIAAHTALGQFEESNSIEDFPSTFAGLPEAERETLYDFRENNRQSYPIQGYLPTSVETIATGNSGDEQTWWISFSRAGFNSSLTEALVLVEEHFDCREGNCSYGTGTFVFLQKADSGWIIRDRFMYWRSHPT